jgi:hypothetical protein
VKCFHRFLLDESDMMFCLLFPSLWKWVCVRACIHQGL